MWRVCLRHYDVGADVTLGGTIAKPHVRLVCASVYAAGMSICRHLINRRTHVELSDFGPYEEHGGATGHVLHELRDVGERGG